MRAARRILHVGECRLSHRLMANDVTTAPLVSRTPADDSKARLQRPYELPVATSGVSVRSAASTPIGLHAMRRYRG